MSPKVRFENEAALEYRSAARWYDERRSGLGLEFLDAVDATLDRVIRLPRAGAMVRGVPADLPVRQAPIKRFPYRVIYLEMDEGMIRVLAVAHDRRRPGYWEARLQ